MRELKFRAWDGKVMVGPFDIGDYEMDHESENGNFTIPYPRGTNEGYAEGDWEQFTGLLDKNGKEIWEGDIVRYEDEWPGQFRQYQVSYGDGWWFPLVRVEEGYNAIDSYSANAFEVIGNIHENPELLNDKT
jgi:hypothetical protein